MGCNRFLMNTFLVLSLFLFAACKSDEEDNSTNQDGGVATADSSSSSDDQGAASDTGSLPSKDGNTENNQGNLEVSGGEEGTAAWAWHYILKEIQNRWQGDAEALHLAGLTNGKITTSKYENFVLSAVSASKPDYIYSLRVARGSDANWKFDLEKEKAFKDVYWLELKADSPRIKGWALDSPALFTKAATTATSQFKLMPAGLLATGDKNNYPNKPDLSQFQPTHPIASIGYPKPYYIDAKTGDILVDPNK